MNLQIFLNVVLLNILITCSVVVLVFKFLFLCNYSNMIFQLILTRCIWLNCFSRFITLTRSKHFQKQPLEAFFKERLSQASGLQLFEKRDSGTGVFLWILRNFKNTFFTEHLQTAASRFPIPTRLWREIIFESLLIYKTNLLVMTYLSW